MLIQRIYFLWGIVHEVPDLVDVIATKQAIITAEHQIIIPWHRKIILRLVKMIFGHAGIFLRHMKIIFHHAKIVLWHMKMIFRHAKIILRHIKIIRRHAKLIPDHQYTIVAGERLCLSTSTKIYSIVNPCFTK